MAAKVKECEQLRVENTGLERDVVDLARMLAELKAAVHQYAGGANLKVA